jgi:hypothetical protein
MKKHYCPNCGVSACVLPSDNETVPTLERGRKDFYCTDCATPFFGRVSFSAMWSDQLGAEIKRRSLTPYPIECHQGADWYATAAAINQGIDSHLEAIQYTRTIGSYGRERVVFNPESVPVLVRRLMESDDDNAQSLASSICETLGIELI